MIIIFFPPGFATVRGVLKKTAVPSQFTWKPVPTPAAEKRAKRALSRDSKKRKIASEFDYEKIEAENLSPAAEVEPVPEIYGTDFDIGASCELGTSSDRHKNTQTVDASLPELKENGTQSNPHSKQKYSIEDFRDDPKGLHYYTGLESYIAFFDVLASLGPASYELNYWNNVNPTISVPDQFLLTIWKCRRYTPNFELARAFGISESDVYAIFVTWIRFMRLQWEEIDIWPDRELVDFFCPSDFKSKFPTTRVILDGFEFPIKKPGAPTAQQVTFSSYKNRNTAKAVVGITPGGLVSHLSETYGGAASDRQITERDNLTQKMEPGDSYMADKGFDVQDIFAPYTAKGNIPSLFRKKNRMSGACVLKDRVIGCKRVHVERVIGLAKTYKIMTQPLNQTETVLAGDIAFVCFMLCNFRECIVPSDA